MTDRPWILDTPIAELAGWDLAIHCAHCREMIVKALIELPDQQQTLAATLARLRCARCGAAPANVQARHGNRWSGLAGEIVRVDVLGDPAAWSE